MNRSDLILFLIYEGKLGSSRADSTFTLKNAEIFSKFITTKIISSRRIGWTVPQSLHTKFDISFIYKDFTAKKIIAFIYHQLKFGFALRKKILNFRKESKVQCILLFHDWWPIVVFSIFKLKGITLVLEVHRNIPVYLLKFGFFNSVHLFIATNKIKYTELVKYIGDKIIIEPNAVDLSQYQFVSTGQHATSESFKIIYTGSLQYNKNPELLIEVAKLIPNLDLVIVGSVPASWDQKRLPDNLFLVGEVNHDLIPGIQKSADALIVTLEPKDLQSAKYSSVMKIFEYIAAKKPIVAPLLPSVLEILSESEYYSYHADDAMSAAAAINDLIKEQKHSRLPNTSRLESISWERRNKRILDKILSISSSE